MIYLGFVIFWIGKKKPPIQCIILVYIVLAVLWTTVDISKGLGDFTNSGD